MKAASKNSKFYVVAESANNALVNIRDWSLSTTRNTIDISTIGTEWKEFLVGQVTGTGSFNLIFDDTDTTAQSILTAIRNGNSLTFKIRPVGDTSGSPEMTFKALPTSWDLSAATEDAISVAVNFQVTEEITQGTVA